ncbi:Aste57867_11006 [Aphanomyces stellatus]|uniref:Aste57867_11006 protein n=1 Tax=Aphanomyces stellatus TaxID=120398 RepID=A0A485KSI1_9STRA|nr:hypothetical protein As57867_010965 [Aphanomyces stellatus]VFT87874.1 Aste57867_11006 [Aphanomyces stellatus]
MEADATKNLDVVRNGVVFRMRPAAASIWSSPSPSLIPKQLLQREQPLTPAKPPPDVVAAASPTPLKPPSSRDAFNALFQKSPVPRILLARAQGGPSTPSSSAPPATPAPPSMQTPTSQRKRYIFRPNVTPSTPSKTSVLSVPPSPAAVNPTANLPQPRPSALLPPTTPVRQTPVRTATPTKLPARPPPVPAALQEPKVLLTPVKDVAPAAKPPTPARKPPSLTEPKGLSTPIKDATLAAKPPTPSKPTTPLRFPVPIKPTTPLQGGAMRVGSAPSSMRRSPFQIEASRKTSTTPLSTKAKTRLSFDPDSATLPRKPASDKDAPVASNSMGEIKPSERQTNKGMDQPSPPKAVVPTSHEAASLTTHKEQPPMQSPAKEDVATSSPAKAIIGSLNPTTSRKQATPVRGRGGNESQAKTTLSSLTIRSMAVTAAFESSDSESKSDNAKTPLAPSSASAKIKSFLARAADSESDDDAVVVQPKKRARGSTQDESKSDNAGLKRKTKAVPRPTKTKAKADEGPKAKKRPRVETKTIPAHGKPKAATAPSKANAATRTTTTGRQTKGLETKEEARTTPRRVPPAGKMTEVVVLDEESSSDAEPTPKRLRQQSQELVESPIEPVSRFLSFDDQEDDDDNDDRAAAPPKYVAMRQWHVEWPPKARGPTLALVLRGTVGKHEEAHELCSMKRPREFVSTEDKEVVLVGAINEAKCTAAGMPQRAIKYFANGMPPDWTSKLRELWKPRVRVKTKQIASLGAFFNDSSSEDDEEDDETESAAEEETKSESTRAPASLPKRENISGAGGASDSDEPWKEAISPLEDRTNAMMSPIRKRIVYKQATPSPRIVRIGSAAKRVDTDAVASPPAKTRPVLERPIKRTTRVQAATSEEIWTKAEVEALKHAIHAVDPTARNYWHSVAALVDGKSRAQCQAKQFESVESGKKPIKPTAASTVVQKLSKAGTKKFKKQVRQFVHQYESTHGDDVCVPSRRDVDETKRMVTPKSIKKFKQVKASPSSSESDDTTAALLLPSVSAARRDELDKYVGQFHDPKKLVKASTTTTTRRKSTKTSTNNMRWADDDDHSSNVRLTTRVGSTRQLEGVMTPRGSMKVRVRRGRRDDESDDDGGSSFGSADGGSSSDGD